MNYPINVDKRKAITDSDCGIALCGSDCTIQYCGLSSQSVSGSLSNDHLTMVFIVANK